MAQELTVYSVGDLEKMSNAFAVSNLFGMKSKEQAMALMFVAQAEGLHPASAAMDYDIIQGRPAKKPQAMLRDFLRNGGKVEWHQHDDTAVSATFSHPYGGSVKIDWDMKRAAAAGLSTKDNWKKYPRQMLRARVISEGVRAVFPGATGGLYASEEVQDFDNIKDVTPVDDTFGPNQFKNSALRNEFVRNVQQSYLDARNTVDLEERRKHYAEKLDAMKNGAEYDQQAWGQLEADYKNAERGLEASRNADKGQFDSIPAHIAEQVEEEF